MDGTLRFPAVDVEYLQVWSPARFTALGLAVYVVLLVISPLQYDYSYITLDGSLYLTLALASFFAGCFVAAPLRTPRAPAAVKPVSSPADRMINLALASGAIGVLARFSDRVVLRGFAIA